MFCPNCGAQLPDDAKFCGQCGANVPDAVQPPESPAETAPVQPAPAEPVAAEPVTEPQPSASIPGPVPEEPILTGRKHSAGIVIGLIAAAVAVIAALVIFVVPMVMQSLSPKAYLSACAANTMSAYAKELDAAGKKIGIQPLYDAAKSSRMESSMSAQLQSVPGTSDDNPLSGAGFRMNAMIDLKGREAAYEASLQYGSAALGTAQVYLKDDLIALGSPEFTGGKFYGVHTETLGADILSTDWGAAADIPKTFRFNYFDMLDMYMNPKDWLSAKTYAALAKESAELLDDAEIEKSGESNQTVNGETEKLKMYTVYLDGDDVAEYITDCTRLVLNDEQLPAALEPMFLAAAAETSMTPDELFAQMKEEILFQLDADQLEASLPETLTLELGTRGKQIASAELKFRMYEDRISVGAELGTKDSLIDALTITIRNGDERMSLSSRGSHMPKDGKFTDTTSLMMNTETLFQMNTSLDTKAKSDNFSFLLTMPGAYDIMSLDASGSVAVDSNKLTADLSRVAMTVDGETLAFSAEYAFGKGAGPAFSGADAQIITDMSESDLEDLMYDIEGNAQDALSRFLQSSPELTSAQF
ncbi:MAG: zinc-ribbon domain-containing protein [Butyricicoccus pullicaecorum]|nr:zinc-ribbon domain-containing protein [Butyricicoccus pullicaecorum]